MKCIHCGKEIPEDSVFCLHCGEGQNAEESAYAKTPAETEFIPGSRNAYAPERIFRMPKNNVRVAGAEVIIEKKDFFGSIWRVLRVPISEIVKIECFPPKNLSAGMLILYAGGDTESKYVVPFSLLSQEKGKCLLSCLTERTGLSADMPRGGFGRGWLNSPYAAWVAVIFVFFIGICAVSILPRDAVKPESEQTTISNTNGTVITENGSGGRTEGKTEREQTTQKTGTSTVATQPHTQKPTSAASVPATQKPNAYETSSQRKALADAKSYLRVSAFSRNGLIHQLEYEGHSNADAAYGADHCGANWNEQAVKSATSYLRSGAFSYKGLIRQLEYEKFTSEQAKYGADRCGANWNEQAVKSATSYLRSGAFSYKGLIRQLEYEKFTSEQAKYGADRCGADWNEQAVKSAKSYLKIGSFTRDSLIAQLEYEGFTHSQAVYGAEKNGY